MSLGCFVVFRKRNCLSRGNIILISSDQRQAPPPPSKGIAGKRENILQWGRRVHHLIYLRTWLSIMKIQSWNIGSGEGGGLFGSDTPSGLKYHPRMTTAVDLTGSGNRKTLGWWNWERWNIIWRIRNLHQRKYPDMKHGKARISG